MKLSAFERILIFGVVVSLAYRYLTDEWPVTVEVDE